MKGTITHPATAKFKQYNETETTQTTFICTNCKIINVQIKGDKNEVESYTHRGKCEQST